MALDDIPLFSMLKDRLGYLNQRQQVIAQNVANSDTPGYVPNDLKPFTLQNTGAASGAGGALAMSQTTSGQMSGSTPSTLTGPWQPHATPDSETRLDGNKVELEEEMMKMQDARMSYETALGMYQKSMSLIQLALKAPGKP